MEDFWLIVVTEGNEDETEIDKPERSSREGCPGYPPQLFNLEEDPGEQNDLGQSAEFEHVRASLHKILLSICDPDDVDAAAKSDQKRKVALHGGQEAVVKKGSFGATPAPS